MTCDCFDYALIAVGTVALMAMLLFTAITFLTKED